MENLKINKINQKSTTEVIKNHILENFSSLEYEGIDSKDNRAKLKRQISSMQEKNETILDTCRHYVRAGEILISNYDIENFLDSLELKTDIYKDDVFNYYVTHVGRVLEKIYFDQI